MPSYTLKFRWGTSRGRNTYGYTTCSLTVDGVRVASCNGGGYDMRGTVVGNWLAMAFKDRLRKLDRPYYGLCFFDPNYDPGKAIVGKDCSNRTLGGADGKTVEEAEKAGESLGLERYQAFYAATTKVPDATHTEPTIDGACGISCMEEIARAIGLVFEKIHDTAKLDIWRCYDDPEASGGSSHAG